MNSIRRVLGVALALVSMSFLATREAVAIPTFQAYIDGGVAGDQGADEDTWFFDGTSFDLFVVGAYGPNDDSITNVTLVVCVPEGETGTISITSVADGNPALLTTALLVDPFNPNADADTDILTDVAGLDGYATKNFLPAAGSFNEHYPFKDDVSDFLLFDLGSFDDSESPLNDYNADGGVISSAGGSEGEQKEYEVSFTGFSQVHFEVYGLVNSSPGQRIASTWDQNPGSHDSTAIDPPVPAPPAIVLGALGLGIVAAVRRRLT